MGSVEVLDFEKLIKFSNGTLDLNSRKLLLEQVRKAYGSGGLGILTVSNVKAYPPLRKKLLLLAQKVANLPESVLKTVMDPETNYLRGWSHGVEKLEDGTFDLLKGSYYANPNFNDPLKVYAEKLGHEYKHESDELKYAGYTRPNIWPSEDLPQLEKSFLELGSLMTSVGVLLAKVCDEFVRVNDNNLDSSHYKPLSEMITESVCNKGRLLHYFPASKFGLQNEESSEKWCGVHCDHSLLTGLTKAMFLTPEFKEVQSVDPVAGLYIVLPSGERLKVNIPEDHIGFQIGHAAQVLSNNFLRATPHLVKAPSLSNAKGSMANISRNTFAVFMQPRWDQEMYTNVAPHKLVEGLAEKDFYSGMTFGHFADRLVDFYHSDLPHQRNSKL